MHQYFLSIETCYMESHWIYRLITSRCSLCKALQCDAFHLARGLMTAAIHPRPNGKSERHNQGVVTRLWFYVVGHQCDRYFYTQLLISTYNTKMHQTGLSTFSVSWPLRPRYTPTCDKLAGTATNVLHTCRCNVLLHEKSYIALQQKRLLAIYQQHKATIEAILLQIFLDRIGRLLFANTFSWHNQISPQLQTMRKVHFEIYIKQAIGLPPRLFKILEVRESTVAVGKHGIPKSEATSLVNTVPRHFDRAANVKHERTSKHNEPDMETNMSTLLEGKIECRT